MISFVSAVNYLFKVGNLSIRTRCESCSILIMSVLTIFNIDDVNGVVVVSLLLTVKIFQTLFYLLTLNRQTFAWFILKRQISLKTRSGISCVMCYFKCEQSLLANSIWTYTITTLWLNQWEIFAKEFISDVGSGWKDAADVQNYLLYVRLSFYIQILLARRLIRELILSCKF